MFIYTCIILESFKIRITLGSKCEILKSREAQKNTVSVIIIKRKVSKKHNHESKRRKKSCTVLYLKRFYTKLYCAYFLLFATIHWSSNNFK